MLLGGGPLCVHTVHTDGAQLGGVCLSSLMSAECQLPKLLHFMSYGTVHQANRLRYSTTVSLCTPRHRHLLLGTSGDARGASNWDLRLWPSFPFSKELVAPPSGAVKLSTCKSTSSQSRTETQVRISNPPPHATCQCLDTIFQIRASQPRLR